MSVSLAVKSIYIPTARVINLIHFNAPNLLMAPLELLLSLRAAVDPEPEAVVELRTVTIPVLLGVTSSYGSPPV